MFKQICLITALCSFFSVGLVAEEEMSLADKVAEARETIEQEEAKNQELKEQLTEQEEKIAELREMVKALEQEIEAQ